MNTRYYCAVGGNGDGTSENTPMPFEAIHRHTFGPGDQLLLRRGDVFYGSIAPAVEAVEENPFVLGAYGEGARPVISLAKIVGEGWQDGGDGFYRFSLDRDGAYEGVRNDNSNIGFMEDMHGVKWGVRRENREACTARHDFYCSDTCLYVKTDVDPFAELGRLKLATHGMGVKAASNMEIRDLHVRDSSGHGIVLQAPGARHIHIHDCLIENIGGGRLGTKGWTKYGNGIELYGGVSEVLVERNILRDVFDVGFTLQGGSLCCWENVAVRHNAFVRNTQSCEVWTSGTAQGQGIHNLAFTGNLCICQGEGWGTPARPDKKGSAGQIKMTDILVYDYKAPDLSISITGNVFYCPCAGNIIYSVSSTGGVFLDKAIIDGNQIYLSDAEACCLGTDVTRDNPYGGQFLSFAEMRESLGFDRGGRLVPINPNRHVYWQMEETARRTDSLANIILSAERAGIHLG